MRLVMVVVVVLMVAAEELKGAVVELTRTGGEER